MTDQKQYVAYYRVSTEVQEKSGLGLEGQRASVLEFVEGKGTIIAEFSEVISGKLVNRPQMQKAFAVCKKKKAILVIARLDRLARNVAFISSLMESKVDFVAVDMPHANRFTVHILAAVGEYERELISQRTKAAMKAAKTRGIRMGSPDPMKGALLAAKATKKKTRKYRTNVLPIIREIQRAGVTTLTGIATALTARGIPTSRGGEWWPYTVKLLLAKGS